MKDFAKSIRTGNALSRGQVLYTRGSKKFVYGGEVNGTHIVYRQPDGKAFSFSSEEGVKQFIKDIPVYESAYVGNKAIVLKDGNVWVVLYANETKSQEFETEEEAREFAKKVGNSKVGNSVPDNLHERFGYRLAVTKEGEGKKETISELEMAISDYKNEISEKEKELSKDKQNLQKLESVLRKYK